MATMCSVLSRRVTLTLHNSNVMHMSAGMHFYVLP